MTLLCSITSAFYSLSSRTPAEAPAQKDMFRIGDRMIEPEMPGLGIDIDEKLVGAQEWKFWEAPHWRRRDGSVQNW
jgi:hypothetical protein